MDIGKEYRHYSIFWGGVGGGWGCVGGGMIHRIAFVESAQKYI